MLAELPELKRRWRTLRPEDEETASLYLEDISREIVRAYPTLTGRMATDSGLAADVARITCNVVRRRLTGEEFEGVEQVSDTQGPYGRSRTFRDRTDDLELTAYERRTLAGNTTVGGQATAAWSNEP